MLNGRIYENFIVARSNDKLCMQTADRPFSPDLGLTIFRGKIYQREREGSEVMRTLC